MHSLPETPSSSQTVAVGCVYFYTAFSDSGLTRLKLGLPMPPGDSAPAFVPTRRDGGGGEQRQLGESASDSIARGSSAITRGGGSEARFPPTGTRSSNEIQDFDPPLARGAPLGLEAWLGVWLGAACVTPRVSSQSSCSCSSRSHRSVSPRYDVAATAAEVAWLPTCPPAHAAVTTPASGGGSRGAARSGEARSEVERSSGA